MKTRLASSFGFWRTGVAVLVLLALWHVASMILGAMLLPRPWEVLSAFGTALGTQEFLGHAWASTRRVLAALALAMATGYPLGLLLGRKPRLDAFVAPLIFLTYPLPKIVLLPVFMILFGLGDLSRILLVALTAGYQILVVARDSARNLDRKYFDAFRVLKGGLHNPKRVNAARMRGWWQTLRHVLVPATLPDALTALKIAGGTAVAILFMAESFATRNGLGFLIMDAWGRGDQTEMFVGILGMSLLGYSIHEGCNILEKRLCRWKHPD